MDPQSDGKHVICLDSDSEDSDDAFLYDTTNSLLSSNDTWMRDDEDSLEIIDNFSHSNNTHKGKEKEKEKPIESNNSTKKYTAQQQKRLNTKIEKLKKQHEKKINAKKANTKEARKVCQPEITLSVDIAFETLTDGSSIKLELENKHGWTTDRMDTSFPLIFWERIQTTYFWEEIDLDTKENEIPCTSDVLQENFALLRVLGKDFYESVQNNEFVSRMEAILALTEGKKLLVVIEGLDTYLNQKKPTAAKKEQLEEIIVWLQIEGNCNIKRTPMAVETAEYIHKTSGAISQKPYKPPPVFDNFCGEAVAKKVQKKVNQKTMWQNQLSIIPGVSEETAAAITEKYPSFKHLMELYLSPGLTQQEKECLLEDIQTQKHSYDKFSKRPIGKALSKRICDIFTSEDGSEKAIQKKS